MASNTAYKNEKRNAQGQFEGNKNGSSKNHQGEKMSSDDGRKNNPKNVERNAQGQFTSEK